MITKTNKEENNPLHKKGEGVELQKPKSISILRN